jgi:uncharacterized protein
MITLERLKEQLNLRPLPAEGGYYSETYRSPVKLPPSALPGHYTGARSLSTAIFYLLTSDTFSAMHMLPGDEIYHFYAGDPVEMLQLHPDGTGNTFILGQRLDEGMKLQLCVPGFSWQGSRLVAGGEWALLGTTMAPGFEFEDFRPGRHDELVMRYPAFQQMISELTRKA